MKTPHFPRILYLLVLVPLLLTACDPSCYPYLVVDQVSIMDGKPYLHVAEKVSWGLGCSITTPDRYYVSPDAGLTWKELVSPNDPRPGQKKTESNQVTSCAGDDQQVCYRIRGESYVERSTDGGSTWKVDWQMPSGRHLYMIRYPGMQDLVNVSPDLVPYDLAILQTEAGMVVLVAYGNQGMLVKSPAGEWNRYPVTTAAEGVRPAAPIPYRAVDFDDAWQALLSETTWIVLMAVCLVTLLSTLSWRRMMAQAPRVKPSLKAWLTLGAVIAGLVLVLLIWLFFLSHRNGAPSEWVGVDTAVTYICLLPALVGAVVLLIILASLPNKAAAWLAGLLALALGLVFIALTWLPFALWAWGILPHYWLAMIAAAISALLVLLSSFLVEMRLVRGITPGPGKVPKN